MHRMIIGLSVFALFFAVGCSGEDAEKAADAAGDAAGNLADSAGQLGAEARDAAHDMTAKAGQMADQAGAAAKDAAGSLAGSAVGACRAFAEKGEWGSALEVCKKAHEMMPDDLALEHAYQQAQAAAAQ